MEDVKYSSPPEQGNETQEQKKGTKAERVELGCRPVGKRGPLPPETPAADWHLIQQTGGAVIYFPQGSSFREGRVG